MGNRVYDVAPFLDAHPGGGDLILKYGGKDVTEIMQNEIFHAHSEAAYEILEEQLIGTLDQSLKDTALSSSPEYSARTRFSRAVPNKSPKKAVSQRTTSLHEDEDEDLIKETDDAADYRVHQFLDLQRPLLSQLWKGGFTKEFYLKQVHRPRLYRAARYTSAPLFESRTLESLTQTPWWIIPCIWLPPAMYLIYVAYGGLASSLQTAGYWLLGLSLWSFVEYGLHRWLFHADSYV